jgi:hypothetical protein
MPSPPVLRVIAIAGHLVADDLAYQAGNRFRFVGRSPTPAKNPDPALASSPLEQRYPPEPREYPDDHAHRYVRRAVKKGGLLPLDEYTARVSGVDFKPPAPAAGKPPNDDGAATARKGKG